MSYTDLWEIVTNAQKGSGYTRSKTTTRAKTILASLEQKGWTTSHLKTTLYNLDDDLLSGWPEELFQEYYMKETAELVGTLDVSLLNMGVKPTKVREVVRVLAPLKNTRYTDKQLLDVALEYLLGWYKPIAEPDASYFLQPDNIGVWIPHHKKSIMNVSYSCRYNIVSQFEQQIQISFPERSGKMFFHTTNWRGALHIMNMINTSKSRTCLDFGYKQCFYVSESVLDAVDWGVKNSRKWQDEVAIIAFHVPHNFQKDFEVKDLAMNVKEWEWAVTSFRDCADLSDVHEYDDIHDFMYGPMLANPAYYKTEGPRVHRAPVMQLAAKTREATRFLYTCMKGAFIFRKLGS